MTVAVAGFLAAVLPLVVLPGASLTLLLRHVGDRGRRAFVQVASGTVMGLYVHAAVAGVGMSALIAGSERSMTVLRLAGAAYLVGLGVRMWCGSMRRREGEAPPEGDVRVAASGLSGPGRRHLRARGPRARSAVVEGLLANVLNPKAASVYLTLAPQFLSDGRPLLPQVMVLATGHAVLTAGWLGLWTVLLHRAARLERASRLRLLTSRVAAVVLVALGVRSAVQG